MNIRPSIYSSEAFDILNKANHGHNGEVHNQYLSKKTFNYIRYSTVEASKYAKIASIYASPYDDFSYGLFEVELWGGLGLRGDTNYPRAKFQVSYSYNDTVNAKVGILYDNNDFNRLTIADVYLVMSTNNTYQQIIDIYVKTIRTFEDIAYRVNKHHVYRTDIVLHDNPSMETSVPSGDTFTLTVTNNSDYGRYYVIFDDFNYRVLSEDTTPWILNKGTDLQAADPAIDVAELGKIVLTTGDNSGNLSDDGSQIVCAIPVQADSGGLEVEASLHINAAITGISVNFGLTDSTSLEEPFSIAAGDTITSTASDAACFVYDADADTKEWFACSVDSDIDDTGNGTTGVAPTVNTYQTLKIIVSSDGNTIKFLINDILYKTLTNAGISPSTNLYATIVANSTTTASKTVDVDYIRIVHFR